MYEIQSGPLCSLVQPRSLTSLRLGPSPLCFDRPHYAFLPHTFSVALGWFGTTGLIGTLTPMLLELRTVL